MQELCPTKEMIAGLEQRLQSLESNVVQVDEINRYLQVAMEWAREINDPIDAGFTHVQRVMRAFGQERNISRVPGDNNFRRGAFLKVTFDGNGEPDITLSNSDQLAKSHIMVALGIDTNGLNFFRPYLRHMRPLIDGNGPITAYHYANSAATRGEHLGNLLLNPDYFSPEAYKVAQRHLKNRFVEGEYDCLEYFGINYSYGTIFTRMVRNAMVHIMKEELGLPDDEIKQYTNYTRTLSFGFPPFWGNGTGESYFFGEKEERTNYFDLQKGREIFVVSATDMIPYRAPLYQKLYHYMMHLVDEERPYRIFHYPDNQDKILICLAPGVTKPSLNKIINFGGHGILHYLHALGIDGNQEGPATGLAEDIRHFLVHPFIEPYREGQEEKGLAWILSGGNKGRVIPLTEEVITSGISYKEEDLASLFAFQLANEAIHWKNAPHKDHPMVFPEAIERARGGRS